MRRQTAWTTGEVEFLCAYGDMPTPEIIDAIKKEFGVKRTFDSIEQRKRILGIKSGQFEPPKGRHITHPKPWLTVHRIA